MGDLRIGIIGTDTSHAAAFTRLLNDPSDPHHVPGGKVIAAFPGGSPDFPLSINRVEAYMEKLRSEYGVQATESPEDVAAQCDAILLEAADGRVHLELFKRIASYGKPVFIDKPLALTTRDAGEMLTIAAEQGIPVMSCSALRYAEQLTAVLEQNGRTGILGTDVYGPMSVEPTQGHYFWYGIHSVEMLYAVMGPGCVELTAVSNDNHDLITAVWEDGRIATVRGSRAGNPRFGAFIHREHETAVVDIGAGTTPFYASLLQQVMSFFRKCQPPLDWSETLEIISFLQAAEKSRISKTTVRLTKKRG
ncbi:Gfo/Idh/MocA family protein [Paenibacillus abyssi]|uniref:Dehydrogenase n=2 Tax=Paenibacillus abyssi TaxID=1340531 RepID=A0A917LFW5_9BACL|nr:Gfo/Idh/MocA family oxidoreductase [Paenibacillus abyssi]GGG19521.1 dehydrogenase [Paenibacillus abyssi]